jgi:capsular polysaccharide transport system permease protein
VNYNAPTKLRPAPDPESEGTVTRLSSVVRKEDWKKRLRIFNAVFLATPLAVASIYLFLIATPVYEVDSVLMVRSPSVGGSPSASGGLSSLLSGATGGGATSAERAVDESYAVVSYLQSREAFNELDRRVKFTQNFSSKDVDWIDRLGARADHEARYQYYLNKIKIYYDDVEGQVNLSTYGFSDATSYGMAKEMAGMSEKLVNEFNDRARNDMIKVAQDQVEQSRKEMQDAGNAITDFQMKNALIDPTLEASSFNSVITGLRQASASKQAEIGSLLDVSKPETARMVELNNMRGALEKQVQQEQSRLTGKTNALAPLLNQYKLLAVNQQLAQTKFASAIGMLQSALLQAEQQKIYVVDIVPARLPEQPILPNKGVVLLIVAGATFVLWLIARLVLASIRDHKV